MICARALLTLLVSCSALAACGGEERVGEVRGLPGTTSTPTSVPPVEVPTTPETAAAEDPQADPGTATLVEPGAEPPPNPGGAAADTPDDAVGTPMGTGEAQPGGASEGQVLQSARFRVDASTLGPSSVRVAPFLAVELVVENTGTAARAVRLVGTDVALDVRGGQGERRLLDGLAPGMYTLSVDGGAQVASLVVGDEAAG